MARAGPVQQFQIRVKRILLAAELLLVLGTFRKDQMQKPEFRAASLSHASEQMQPEVMSR
jgi:hypothetical protein